MINVVILLAIIIVNLTIGIVSYFKTGDWRLLLIASILALPVAYILIRKKRGKR